MPLFLKNRNEQIKEQMDQPDCDEKLLFNTYQQFATINRLISGWQRVYQKFIKPVFSDPSKTYSILDIGCGGGDILRLLDRLTKKDGFLVTFTGIDPDARAFQFLSDQEWLKNISFLRSTSTEIAEKKQSFDIVISNHLVHHLAESQLTDVCQQAGEITRKRIIFNDIERSDIGYVSFKLSASLIFHNSFIVPDGLTSIKRSFRKEELQEVLPEGWAVHRQFPFRLLAVHDAKS